MNPIEEWQNKSVTPGQFYYQPEEWQIAKAYAWGFARASVAWNGAPEEVREKLREAFEMGIADSLE